jgi:hypothetical protein
MDDNVIKFSGGALTEDFEIEAKNKLNIHRNKELYLFIS